MSGHASIPVPPVHIAWRRTGIGEGEFASLEAFRAAHPGATIESIDDREVMAWCEDCGGPLFADDPADNVAHDGDGIYWHKDGCPPNGEVAR